MNIGRVCSLLLQCASGNEDLALEITRQSQGLLFFGGVIMEINQITEFWLDSPILEKFKKIGEFFEKKIQEENKWDNKE